MIRTTNVKIAIAQATDTGWLNSSPLSDYVSSRARDKNKATKPKQTAVQSITEAQARINQINKEAAEREALRQKKLAELDKEEREAIELSEKQIAENEKKRRQLKESQIHATNHRSRKSSDARHLHALDVAKILDAIDSLPEIQRVWLYYAFANPDLNWLSKRDIENFIASIHSKYCYVLVSSGNIPSEKVFAGVYRALPMLIDNCRSKYISGREKWSGAEIVTECALRTRNFNRDYGKHIEVIDSILHDVHTAASLRILPQLPGNKSEMKQIEK